MGMTKPAELLTLEEALDLVDIPHGDLVEGSGVIGCRRFRRHDEYDKG